MTDFPQLGKVWILLVSLGHCKLRKPKIFKSNTNVERLGESKDIMLENKFSLFFKKRELCSWQEFIDFSGGEKYLISEYSLYPEQFPRDDVTD